METNHEFDFAVSYAGPDQQFVTEVVAALRARGLTVFHAPDEQADMIGRNLLDYLHTVYLSKARYCLLFASKHYAERKWTNKVERPAAQERALEQDERYIIPIRLDDTRITGLSGNTLDIRNATARQIADLCVAVMLRDEEPSAISGGEGKRDRLILRIKSFTELDTDLLRQSFKPFAGWATGNASLIPVELRLPKILAETIKTYEAFLSTEEGKQVDSQTVPKFSGLVSMIRDEFQPQVLRAASLVLGASQPNYASSLVLTDDAVELIRRYVLAKTVALARCLVTWQLKAMDIVPWARHFADCDKLSTPRLMGGLPWLCRAEGSEKHLWFNADITGWGESVGFDHVRIFRPSTMITRRHNEKPTAKDVLHFISPQLVEWELDGRMPRLLRSAMRYPERIEITYRNEVVIECKHFHEVSTHGYGSEVAHPAMSSMADELVKNCDGTREGVCNALAMMHAAEFAVRDNRAVILPAVTALYAMLEKYAPSNSGDSSNP